MWKQIVLQGIETNYEVSNMGEVKNTKTKKTLKGSIKANGYKEFQLSVNGERKHLMGHRLVALMFIPNPNNKEQVNHINGDKLDNRVENLEWNSSSENNRHAWNNDLNSAADLRAVIQKNSLGEKLNEFISISEASRETGCHRSKIIAVANGDRKTTGGFVWEWKENFIKKDIGKKKKVVQMLNGEIISVFDSVSEASRETGSNRKGISAVCLGKQKTCNDFEWKFVEDDIVQ